MAALIGKKRSASPPDGGEPPAKKAALGPPAEPAGGPAEKPAEKPTGEPPGAPRRKWYFTKLEDIPQSIRAKKIAKFSVEVIYKGDNADDHPLNHSITRLTFQHKQAHDTGHLAAGTMGILVDLHVNPMDLRGPGAGGDLLVRTFSKGKAGRKEYKTVKDFLQVIPGNDMIPCGFNTDEWAVGCKDFTSQYIYRLNEAKVLDIPAAAAHDIYDRFNYNYAPGEEDGHVSFKLDVGHAIFNPIYYEKYLEIPDIDYVGRLDESNTAIVDVTEAASVFETSSTIVSITAISTQPVTVIATQDQTTILMETVTAVIPADVTSTATAESTATATVTITQDSTVDMTDLSTSFTTLTETISDTTEVTVSSTVTRTVDIMATATSDTTSTSTETTTVDVIIIVTTTSTSAITQTVDLLVTVRTTVDVTATVTNTILPTDVVDVTVTGTVSVTSTTTLTFTATAAAATCSVNLIQNPDFSDGSLTLWQLRLLGSVVWPSTTNTATAGQTVTTVAGETYTFSYYYYLAGGNSASTLTCTFNNDDDSSFPIPIGSATKGSWTLFSCSVLASSTSTEFACKLSTTAVTIVLISDFSLEW
ncbi:hypothetical protein N7486_006387 [Penicillium sp. IBT 16267x]|nr:hypothetical protein N7486_006387 [Penicillium sp. IBT 16267x]